MDIKEVILRLKEIRLRAGLSQRELSDRTSKNHQHISKVEKLETRLTVESLLDILLVCNYPVEKFFYPNPDEYDADQELLSLFKNMSKSKKEALISFLKK